MQRTGSFRSLPTPSPRPMFADLLCAFPVAMSDTTLLAPPPPNPAQLLTMQTPNPSPPPTPVRAPTPEWLLIRRNLMSAYWELYISEAFEAYYYSFPNTATNTANDLAYAATDAADTNELLDELGCYYDAELRGSLLHDTSFRPFIGGGSEVQAETERRVIGPIVLGVPSIWTRDMDEEQAQAVDAEGGDESDGRGTINDDIDSGVDVDEYDVNADGLYTEDGEGEEGEDQASDESCDEEGDEDQEGNGLDSDEDGDDEAEDDSDDEEDDEEEEDEDDEDDEGGVSLTGFDDVDVATGLDNDLVPIPAPGSMAELLRGSEPIDTETPGAQDMHGAVGDGRPLRGDADENAADADEDNDHGDWDRDFARVYAQFRSALQDELDLRLRRDLLANSDWLPTPAREGRNPNGAVGDGRPRRTTVQEQGQGEDDAVANDEQRVITEGTGQRNSRENGQRPIRFSDGFVLQWMRWDLERREPITRPWRELRDLMARGGSGRV